MWLPNSNVIDKVCHLALLLHLLCQDNLCSLPCQLPAFHFLSIKLYQSHSPAWWERYGHYSWALALGCVCFVSFMSWAFLPLCRSATRPAAAVMQAVMAGFRWWRDEKNGTDWTLTQPMTLCQGDVIQDGLFASPIAEQKKNFGESCGNSTSDTSQNKSHATWWALLNFLHSSLQKDRGVYCCRAERGDVLGFNGWVLLFMSLWQKPKKSPLAPWWANQKFRKAFSR